MALSLGNFLRLHTEIRMEKYFNINYEFDRKAVERSIDETLSRNGHGYIAVADGVVLNTAQRDSEYMRVLNDGMFAICDSSYVPLYIRLLYGRKRSQYCGAMIFEDLVKSRKYRMAFLGTNTATLEALRENVAKTMNADVRDMLFYELPFCTVDEFDYEGIARMIEEDGADIVWVALGAPKQEIFINRLNGRLSRGVMIAVGAVFKFFSGNGEKRAPKWIVRCHLEFIYRIMQAPKKQMKRCAWILLTLPGMLYREWKRKSRSKNRD